MMDEMVDEREEPASASRSAGTSEDETAFAPPSIAEMRKLPDGLFTLVEGLRTLPTSEATKSGFLKDLLDIKNELEKLGSPLARKARLMNNVAFCFFPSSASFRARVLLFRRLVVPLSSSSGTGLQFAYTFGDLLNSRVKNRTSESPLCFDLADTMQWKFESSNLSSSKSTSTSDSATMKYPEIFHLFHSKVSPATYGSEDFEQNLKAETSLLLLRRAAEESDSTASTSGTNVTWRSATHKMYLDLGRKNQDDNKSDEIDTSDTAKVQILAKSNVLETANGLTQDQTEEAARILVNTVGNNFIANHMPVYIVAILGLVTTFISLVSGAQFFYKSNKQTSPSVPANQKWFLIIAFLLSTALNIIALVLFLSGDFTDQNRGTLAIVVTNFVLWFVLLGFLLAILRRLVFASSPYLFSPYRSP